MARNGREKRGSGRKILVLVVLAILVSIQVVSSNLEQSRAAYYGIAFGTEAEVSSDGSNDIWQLEKLRYTYIANDQIKPEVDLLGLNVTRDANATELYLQSDNITVEAQNGTVDYNHSFIFIIPLVNMINVTYTFSTNQTYNTSAVEFYNWTSPAGFVNQSKVTNVTAKTEISSDFYNKSIQEMEILIHFNITHTTNFTLWFNLTFELEYSVDQIISVFYNNVTTGDADLVDNLRTWVFLDVNGDDKVDYAIKWEYENRSYLYSISPDAFGWWAGELRWTGDFEEHWTGINWQAVGSGSERNIGVLGTNTLNITLPEFIANLTSSVKYAVWSQKTEPTYDWWDTLPNDTNWELGAPIPGFQLAFLGLGLFLIVVMFIKRIKNPHKGKGMVS